MKLHNTYQIRDELLARGWGRPPADTIWKSPTYLSVTKRYGRLFVDAVLDPSIWAMSIGFAFRGRGLPEGAGVIHYNLDEMTLDQILASLDERAKAIQARMAPRTKRDLSGVRSRHIDWSSGDEPLEGQAALDEWYKVLEATILEMMENERREIRLHRQVQREVYGFQKNPYEYPNTKKVTEYLMSHFSCEPPEGIHRSEAGRHVRKVLDRLARAKKVDKLEFSRHEVLWAPREESA